MRSLAPVARYVLWLLCAVILVTRISGAHVHLCFDGTEPLVSVHTEESRLDLGHELSGQGHSDVELDEEFPLLIISFCLVLAVPDGNGYTYPP